MALPTVAILAPGDMGHGVGGMLRRAGVRVMTNLAGRSARTIGLAKAADIEAMPDDEALVRAADIVLSIAPPAEAVGIAQRIATALRTTGQSLVYADCNAVAPATTQEIGRIVENAGARFVDAGIIGPPPKAGETRTRIYVSGPHAAEVTALSAYGLDVRAVDGGIGAASALKMCYAATTKGTQALATQALVAASLLGVGDALRDEFKISRANFLADIQSNLPRIPPKAYRWVAEMEEIGATFGSVGLTPEVFRAIASVYELVANAGGTAANIDEYVTSVARAAAGRKSAAE
jgi:3-hydroxyisobutyrate dehydrogenase-like beta-hydroxyacid dehydrogenase